MKFFSVVKLTEICGDKYFCVHTFHKHQLRFPKYVEKIFVRAKYSSPTIIADCFFFRFLPVWTIHKKYLYLPRMTGSELTLS